MSDLIRTIANLTPDEKAELIAHLKAGKANVPRGAEIDFSRNHEWRFRSDMPFDLAAVSFEAGDPDPDCVQIDARAAGVNFRDVMIALRIYPMAPDVPSNMASDYAGVVTKVGSRVTRFKPGDHVVAMNIGHVEQGHVRENSHFAKCLNIYEMCVFHKPKQLAFVEAALIPTVYLTAWYALVNCARLERGGTVLIHTATGGVGLAAIEIARHIGAKIVATAGTPEKRAYLVERGIEHVFDSRSSRFAAEMRSAGIVPDTILNTLAGDLMLESLKLLGPFGHFVHIDKKDVATNAPLPLGYLIKGLSFHFLDISLLLRNPRHLESSFAELASLFEAGSIRPIRYRSYRAAEVKQAITEMSRGTHLGKLVIEYDSAQ
ncbi:zinc-binding dehydrogenase [Paraburkholderia humisilvae]|uniref:Mycocerosic acid synthase n=1 Tax=Paraburkholderia humisilvae TaxID=627669 RepID=A0A6J5F7K4_9BURK|nr:zinc-binding dehydrogenase [Paraburkholderia humisilvae]CAB3773116.1 Mycocerosic acid synthase [Paraburkholderia humisilvae]